MRGSISGTVTANGGVIALGTQRMAFIVPGLADAENPVLIVTLKNDDGTGNPVANMKLYVGDSYSVVVRSRFLDTESVNMKLQAPAFLTCG